MKLSMAAVSILGLASASLAQNAAQATSDRAQPSLQNFTMAIEAPSSCPVRLHALQGMGTGLVAVRDAKPTPGPSQRIHLVLSDATATHVVSAKIIVRGLSGRNHLLHAQLTRGESSDAAKTLDVRFAREDDNSVAADLLLPGFTSVSSVELESIRYDDGSNWAVAGNQACRVAPDPLMLVAGR